jgi:hypothetical protein
MLMFLDYTAGAPSGGTHITWPTGSGAVTAVDMTTKEKVWSFPTKTTGVLDLQIRNDILYFCSNFEGIYALNASTGKVIWLHPELPNSGFFKLLVTQDTVYASASGTLIGVDLNTGREKLRVDMGRALRDLVYANNMLLYGSIWEPNSDKYPNCEFHQDDWIFVEFSEEKTIGNASERRFYMRTNSMANYPWLESIFRQNKLENVKPDDPREKFLPGIPRV